MAEMFLDISVQADRIPDAAERVARFGAHAGFDKEDSFQIQVVVAEALNNILCHGLRDCAAGSIGIHCGIIEAGLEITIRDHGMPLGHLPNASFPDVRAEHGRGWPIIIAWADGVEYRSTPGRNDLTLTKHFS